MNNIAAYYLNKIPNKGVSITDFPYFENYLAYLMDISDKYSQIKVSREKIKIILVDTPHYETHFIHTPEEQLIIIDISFSLLVKEMSEAISKGQISKDLWESVLGYLCDCFIEKGIPDVALSFALNVMEEIETDETISLPFKIDDFNDKLKGWPNISIYIQEMFFTAHEIVHYSFLNDILNNNNFNEFLSDVLEHSRLNLDNDLLFTKLIKSDNFRQEIVCDVAAISYTIDYFTWDAGTKSLFEVVSSIKVAMTCMFLIRILRSRLNEENSDELEALHLRYQIIEAVLLRILITSENVTINQKLFFQLFLSKIYNLRAMAFEKFFFDDLLSATSNIAKTSSILNEYFEYPKQSAYYFRCYDTNENYTEDFMKKDAIKLFDSEKRKEILGLIKTNIYVISKKSKDGINELMNEINLLVNSLV